VDDPRNRSIYIRSSLDRFNGTDRLYPYVSASSLLWNPQKPLTSSRDLAVLSWQLDEDYVSKGFLGIVGDSDGTDVGLRVKGDPLVVGGEAGCGR
jgi:hypothetical protein